MYTTGFIIFLTTFGPHGVTFCTILVWVHYLHPKVKMVASRKRKREHVGGGDDDDDDNTTYGLRQILPVASLPIDFDGEPTDGMQYLFTVRYVLSTTSSRMSKTG
jgi:hypothetical protein